uniref:Sec-independent protein translocase component TatC n=1 Tax=Polyopes affinis TaxID=194519 RepID=UPI00202904EA|nr:Sec-independent protein translocase component TatC [Polyopes affinis]UQJ72514.1 Sec-independent protein translocase component TatC [Polyopes affinis]
MLYFYSIEIAYRIFYIIISFVFCLVIGFWHVQIWLLIETYPFLQFSNKKFIATQTTDLIDAVWIITFSTSFLFVYPFFVYQIVLFSKNSWYEYQIHFIIKLFFYSLMLYIISLLFCYYFFLPILLDFLSQWEIKQTKSILNIEIEFRILNYVQWTLTFRYVFCFIFYIITFFTCFFSFLLNSTVKYNLLKSYRKLFIFFNILFIFLIIPSDFYLQFFVISYSFIFYELIFFFLCYKRNSTYLEIN